MAKDNKKISGIYIPLALDTSRMQESIASVNKQLESLASTIINSLDRNLNIAKTVNNFDSLYRSIGNAQNAAKALSTVNTGKFVNDLSASDKELKKLATTFGITVQAQKEFMEQAYRNQAIEQEVNSIRALSRSLGMATEDFIEFAKVRGISFSGEALDKLIPERTVQRVDALTKSYKELVATSGALATTEGLKKFIDANLIKEAVNASRQLNNSQKITKQQFIEIAQATNTSVQQVKALVAEMDKAQRAGRNLFVSAFTPSNIVAGLQSGASAFGVVGGAYGIAELVKSSYQASMRLENLNLAFKSIYSSAEMAAQKMEYVGKLSEELGLSFLVTADGAKKLFASAKGTVLEDKADDILKAFSTMGAALKLTGSEMESVFLAISQMLSKGKVSAEELRLQLAERMPGAVTLFARAIGKSTSELDAMLQKGQVGLDEFAKFADLVQATYAEGAREASKGLQAELNRISTAWLKLKQSFVDAEGSAEVLRSITAVIKTITENAPQISALASGVTKLTVAMAIAYGSAKLLGVAFSGWELAKTVVLIAKTDGAINALRNTLVYTATSANKLATIFGGWKTVLAGIAAALYIFTGKETEAEKAIRSTSKTLKDYIDVAQEKIKIDKQSASVSEETAENLYKATKRKLNALTDEAFGGVSGLERSLQATIPLSFRFNEKGLDFANVMHQASEAGLKFAENYKNGIEKGMEEEDLRKLVDEIVVVFNNYRSMLDKMGVGDDILNQFDEITGGFVQLNENLNTATKNLNSLKASLKDLEKTGITLDTSKAFNAFTNLQKLGEGLSTLKDTKLITQLGISATDVSTLSELNRQAQILVDTQGISIEQYKSAQYVQEQFGQSIKSLSAYLFENNISVEEFAKYLESVDEKARLSNSAMALLLGTIKETLAEMSSANIDTFFEGIDKKLLTGKYNRGVVSVAEDLTKGGIVTNTLEETLALISSGQYELLQFREGAKLTTEQMVTLGKYVQYSMSNASNSVRNTKTETEKLIESLQNFKEKYEVKSLSDAEKVAKDFAEQYAIIDKALASGKGTSVYRAQLATLRQELKLVEQAEIDRIKTKEAQERAETRAEEFRRFNAEFSEIMGTERDARLANIDEWYDEERARWQSLLLGKIVDAEEYNEKLTQLEQMYNMKRMEESRSINDQMKLTLDSWFSEYENIAPQIADFTTDAFRTAADAIGDFAASGLRDIDSLGDAFSNMADQMLQTAARMFSNQMFSSMFQWIGGGTSGSGLFSWLFSAKGNVFANSPNLHKFSNSVITKPTLFNYGTHVKAYAKGAGLMGEAGPEAVVPLVRTSSGHLGVRTTGEGSGTIVNVNVINKSDAQVTTRESQDSQGNTNIEFLIEKQVGQAMRRPGSEPYRALNNTYGANMRLANR